MGPENLHDGLYKGKKSVVPESHSGCIMQRSTKKKEADSRAHVYSTEGSLRSRRHCYVGCLPWNVLLTLGLYLSCSGC